MFQERTGGMLSIIDSAKQKPIRLFMVLFKIFMSLKSKIGQITLGMGVEHFLVKGTNCYCKLVLKPDI